MTDLNPVDAMTTDFRAELQLLFDAAESFTEPALGHHRPWAAALDRARALLAQPESQSLPANYIDPEHTGQDREVLEIFYTTDMKILHRLPVRGRNRRRDPSERY
jgi:hypothetical protein